MYVNKKKYNQGLQPPPPNGKGGYGRAVLQGASSGASLGSFAGPLGTAIGGVVGGIGGAVAQGLGNKVAKEKHKGYMINQEAYKNMAYVMNSNSEDNALNYQIQAAKGYQGDDQEIVEIEGDGSGDSQNGIGEIVTDKNYNIKHIAKGGKTHEEGGEDIISDDDTIIFPTQKSKSTYNKILRDIKKANLGDPKAKNRLDKRVESLPTDEDYGYENNENMSKKYPSGYTGYKLPYDLSPHETGNNPVTTGTEQIFTDHDSKFDYKYDEVDGKWYTRKKGDSEFQKMEDSPEFQEGIPVLEQKYGFKNNKASSPQEVTAKAGAEPTAKDVAEAGVDAGVGGQPSKDEMADKQTDVDSDPIKSTKPSRADEIANTISKLNTGLSGVGAYSKIYNDYTRSREDIRQRPEFQYDPEEVQYQDRSADSRRDALEMRNAALAQTRGSGLTRGQYQGVNSNIMNSYRRNIEGINTQEVLRQDAVANQNVDIRNRASLYNLQDDKQAFDYYTGAEARRNEYGDMAAKGLSEISQLNQQRQYMINKDRKMDERDQRILDSGLIGFREFETDGETWATKYKKQYKKGYKFK